MVKFPILLTALIAVSPSLAQTAFIAPAPGLAAIDDAGGGGIRDWHAVNARGIYLRDRINRWYYATFRHECPGVLYDQRIEFITDGSSRFDRLSRVKTENMTCGVAALDASPPPADKGRD